MPYGYAGKILKVNLTTRSLAVETPPEEFYRKYMGGSALNMHYMLSEMEAGVDPLSPENILCLSIGVTTGVNVAGMSRLTVTAKSPLTGCIGDSQSGGFFPAEMKFAGFDAIIVTGKADSPVYLWLTNGKSEIRDAAHLWGKETAEVESLIKDELNDSKIRIAQCGPAGEKQVHYAAIISNANRANGRTGMGAVMGSKNLRAIAVRGTQRPALFDPAGVKALAAEGARKLSGSGLESFGKFGTSSGIELYQESGGLPTYNFADGVFDEGWEGISSQKMWDEYRNGHEEGKQNSKGRDTCYACIIRCKPVVKIDEGKYQVDPIYGGPEYESIAALGSYCGISSMPAVARANQLCNAYGIDTISCGATIAWAMECFENGLLTTKDTDGLELNFGNADAMLQLIKKIADRDGFGDILADGSEAAAKRLGFGKQYLITSKGMEAPAHMPQLKRSLAIVYATNPFGADHESHEHDPFYEKDDFADYKDRLKPLGLDKGTEKYDLGPEKIRYACRTQQYFSFLESLNLCHFAWGPAWELFGVDDVTTLLKTVTGWDVPPSEQLLIGERRLNMMRAFNAREGIGRERDTLPEKFFSSPLRSGPTKGLCLDRQEFNEALEEYYRQAGWDSETGNPTPETYARLDLDRVAELVAASPKAT